MARYADCDLSIKFDVQRECKLVIASITACEEATGLADEEEEEVEGELPPAPVMRH
jgi:hypothetical protein